MQTIINPYKDLLNTIPNPQTEGEYQLRASYKTMMLAFNDGVKAAQQAPIVKKVVFAGLKAFCLGYLIEIYEDEPDLFILDIYKGERLIHETNSFSADNLKLAALEFLSDLVTTELGHPVKFELC